MAIGALITGAISKSSVHGSQFDVTAEKLIKDVPHSHNFRWPGSYIYNDTVADIN
jgi:hypothetical protein